MTASPYDGPDTSQRTDQTTIWRDGEVIRRDGRGQYTVRESVPAVVEKAGDATEIKSER